MIVILMGVSGSGKTTVGQELAGRLGWRLFDADDYHPAANIEKMSRGVPLEDADRWPWLDRLNAMIREADARSESTLLACSALKARYRERLGAGLEDVRWVYLKGDFALIESRLLARKGHYMKAGLLQSQFAALEEPGDALIIDIAEAPAQIAGRLVAQLGLERVSPTS
ncbi:MAG TPA: gluconokinase [Burkholderiales bacterium]|jgi:gluconokinase|nr:gluconokinase [Burkholderiales bacterium]